MRILVVSTNTLLKPMPVLPVGAGMVYSALKAAGFEARFLDMAFVAEPLEALRDELRACEPELICLSVRNIDNQVIQQPESYLSFVHEVMKVCRTCSSAKVMIGGAAMLVMPGELVEELGADYGIKGSGGEAEAVRLVHDLERGMAPDTGTVRNADPAYHPVYSRIPAKSLFSPQYFIPNPRIKKASMGYQASRGCSRHCIYCSEGYMNSGACRIPAEQFMEDMRIVQADYQVNSITFVDGVFNHEVEETIEFCGQIGRTSTSLEWSCALTPANITEELIRSLKHTGCRFVDIGADSGSGRMLRRMGKQFTPEHLLELGRLLEQYHIPYSVSLLFGGPGEHEETVQETVQLVNQLNPVYILASQGIRIYPHTALYNIALQEQVIHPADNLLLPAFYQSRDYSTDLLTKALAASRHIYKDMLMNSIGGRT
ncbi:radical SAM protein [Paenibacillus tritici]|uniref:Radical SAM protein n=1 Tax=Paenibacillus tritici TaxID=1873425 RepID=A0ABX2DY93_9BACL|nr:radical SAM protein [Paenibacillus tritici]NQX49129.1 radical SAM protein [Paenibacillus tritici]QUL56056.1 radical SAM protein [Paenibacillus tritici]